MPGIIDLILNRLHIDRVAGDMRHRMLQREKMLMAANREATLLLRSDTEDLQSLIVEGLEILCRSADMDRVRIWKNHSVDGRLCYRLVSQWFDNRMPPPAPLLTSNETKELFYMDRLPSWLEKFMRGETINGPVATMPEPERSRLLTQGMKSVLIVPIHLEDRLWGFIGFEDCRQERFFPRDEEAILCSAGLLIANAIARDEMKKKMQEADELARIMLDATPLGCTLWDKNGKNYDCNMQAVRLFGMKDKQEFLTRFFDLSPERQPDGQLSRTKSLEHIFKALQDGQHVFEWTHRTLDGVIIPMEVTVVRIRSNGGDFLCCYMRDLREHKRMMQEIERRDELLSTVNATSAILLSSSPDEFKHDMHKCMGMIAYRMDRDRMYVWKNYERNGKLHATQILEWSEGAAPQQGHPHTTNLFYDDMSGWEEKLRGDQCINRTVSDFSSKERALFLPQGIRSIMLVPIFLHGIFWGFVGMDNCRTEQHASENEEDILRSEGLIIAHAILRNEMTQDILRAKEKALNSTNYKSRFLASMSHEIRTPLNAVIGMTAIGEASNDPERQKYAFGKIKDASIHLLGVINEVLDMSKIEAGKLELAPVTFRFEQLLQRVATIINYRVEEKHQKFQLHADPTIPSVLIGDDQRLAQVITNLLSNSVKFTPDGGSITLETRLLTEESEENGAQEKNGAGDKNDTCLIRFAVKDTGIGISKEQQARLFHSFTQAENVITRQYGGTGLGLAISKHMVELMGGKIWIESNLAQGTTIAFTVRMRRGTVAQSPEASPEEQYALASVGDDNFSGRHILLAEDLPINQEIVREMLKSTGVVVDCAGNGNEAVEMFSDHPDRYDMIFMDIQMPELDGYNAARQIRALGGVEARSIPIVAMTADVFKEDIEKCTAAGMNGHIGKPLLPDALLQCLRRYLPMPVGPL